MAITVTIGTSKNQDNILGKTKKTVGGSLAFDNAYPTNGYAVLNSALGLKTVDLVDIPPTGAYIFAYNPTTSKIRCYGGAGAGNALVEVSANTDLSTYNAVVFSASGTELT